MVDVAVIVVLEVGVALLDGMSANGRTDVEAGEPQPVSAAAHTTTRIGAAARTGTSGELGATQDHSLSLAGLLRAGHSSETLTVTSRTDVSGTVGPRCTITP